MTIDKIKHYISNNELFEFWCNCKDTARLNVARELLLSELKGLPSMRDIKHVAEYYLLCHLTNVPRENYN